MQNDPKRLLRSVAFACVAAVAVQGAANAQRPQPTTPPAPQITAAPTNTAIISPRAEKPTWMETRPDPVGPIKIDPAVLQKIGDQKYVQKVVDGFIKLCTGKSVGCAVAAATPSGAIAAAAVGDARRAPDSDPRKLSADDKITIASVSKTWTAATLLKFMAEKNISVDSVITPYLPPHWTPSAKAKTLTFRMLLRHQSGLECGGIDYAKLRSCIQSTTLAGAKTYHNENFALMRIMIPIIKGIPDAAMQTNINSEKGGDPAWIAASFSSLYREHVNKVVFKPAGLPTMDCQPTDAKPALSYKSATANKFDFSKVGPGDAWGDMRMVCGSQGWFMSAKQLAQSMNALNQPDKVLPAAVLDQMRKEQLGVWYQEHSPTLKSWSHGGYHPAEMNKGEINTVAAFFSNGVSVGVVINSPYSGASIYGDVVAAVMAAEK